MIFASETIGRDRKNVFTRPSLRGIDGNDVVSAKCLSAHICVYKK